MIRDEVFIILSHFSSHQENSWQSLGYKQLVVTASTIIFVDSMPNMLYLLWIAAAAVYALEGPTSVAATDEKAAAILLLGNQSGKQCLK